MAYSKEKKEIILNNIFTEIINGRAVRNVLKDEGMPDVTTFYNWIDTNEDKSKQYARACEARADKIFDDILDISDSYENDVIKNADGIEVVNYNVIQRDRLRVDSRKWIASKLNPKKYGDKNTTTLEGGDKPIHIINLGSGTNPDE